MFLLKGLTGLLSFAGRPGRDLAVNLWGIHFIFASLCALGVKELLKALRLDHVVDNGSLTRLGGLSVDLMLAASIGAISLVVVTRYWLPITVLSVVGGVVVFYTVPWFCSRLFTDHRFHRTLMIYGVSTGTLPTGLALLRVIDPDFETPVATDYMYASGLTFVAAIPFILIINLPAYWHSTGNPLYLWITIAVSLGYLLFVLMAYRLLSRKRAYPQPLHPLAAGEGEGRGGAERLKPRYPAGAGTNTGRHRLLTRMSARVKGTLSPSFCM